MNQKYTSKTINLGSCMLGGYNDDKVNTFLGIDGVFETINNIIVIGKSKLTIQSTSI